MDIKAGRLPQETLDRNFLDLHPAMAPNEARVAAERCLFCHDAPCVTACPTSIDIPMFIRQIGAHNPIGAAETILSANIMGAMCARVCPTENLCEGACVREVSEGKAIEIGRLQRFATDAAFAAGKQFFRAGNPTGKRVAVIGAGPAGLSAAHRLAVLGHQVTIYEGREKSGGLNEYGIAAYKATDSIAAREVEYILAVGGISVIHGKRLGRDITLPDLEREFDAVFLGIGLGDTNDLGLGAEPEGVMDAVDYIAKLRQAANRATLPVGRRVVVIGGGMTAVDIAVQARKLGAQEVTIAYRRSRAEMPASEYEQEIAQHAGVTIREHVRPKTLLAEGGKLAGVELEYLTASAGKLTPTGETVILPCDQLFKAIGQTLVPGDFGGEAGLAMKNGRILVDESRRTSRGKVFAGGDCIFGGKDLTVSAVEDGKQAAHAIDAMLKAARAA